jgi:hypothetical protein
MPINKADYLHDILQVLERMEVLMERIADKLDVDVVQPCTHEYTPNMEGTMEWCQKCDSVRPKW